MKTNMQRILAPAFAGIVLSSSLHAAVGVSNLGELGAGFGYPVDMTYRVGMSFTTGAGAGWSLQSVDMSLFSLATSGGGGVLTLSLNADLAGLPGGHLVTLDTLSPIVSLTPTTYNFTPTAPLSLAPLTTYWLLAPGSGADFVDPGINWQKTGFPGFGETGLPGWTILDGVANSFDGGASWYAMPQYEPAMFGVNVSDVPEPQVYALFAGLGLAGFAVLRRRRR
ncbi:MAG: PEP-CTERM sorting domain-containing protein [Verrucomicrobiales bacterium]|nr:PEP-CTERM sorting domain-containing protein [Verrucomicrobiales bacterium]